MDKEELIQRQKEITKKLRAKPEVGSGGSGLSWKHRKKLNEELREINQKLRALPDYKSHLEALKSGRKHKKKKPITKQATKTPRKTKTPTLSQEGYKRVKELIEKHHELQARLEVVGDKDMRRSLREELTATENLIQEYEPYLKGYKVIREKRRSKGSRQWIHMWQGGAPQ